MVYDTLPKFQQKAFTAAEDAFADCGAAATGNERHQYYRTSADCYVRGGQDLKAADTYLEGKEFELAAKKYRKTGSFDRTLHVLTDHHAMIPEKTATDLQMLTRKLKFLEEYDLDCTRIPLLESRSMYYEVAGDTLIRELPHGSSSSIPQGQQNIDSTSRAADTLLEIMWCKCSFRITPEAAVADDSVRQAAALTDQLHHVLHAAKAVFKNDVAVARHMSQPRSGCSTWLQDLACFRPESDDSHMDSDDEPNISMDMDDGPNIPDIESGGFGDWDEMSRGSTGGSESQGMPTHNSEVIDSYPDCAQTYGKGYHQTPCNESVLPISSRKDWEVGSWLLRSGLSMGKIDSFLSLEMLDFTPRRVYTTAQRLCRVFSEWATGDDAWNMQSALPKGATLLGTILSSDKTNVSTMTGDRVAHPLLISLAKIRMSTRLKSSSNAFVLTALLPVPKFIYKKKRMRGPPAKGVMLSDPIGHSRYCFTPLASYIVDTPEAMMLLAVGGKTSPVTMVMYKQFGDSFRHEPRTRATTLSQLATARSKVDPDDIEAFFREAQKFRLNGVNTPFWLDWPLSDHHTFLLPSFLPHPSRVLRPRCKVAHLRSRLTQRSIFGSLCCRSSLGSVIFMAGFQNLNRLQDALNATSSAQLSRSARTQVPSTVMAAVRALMDFRYLVQSPVIDDIQLTRISMALEEFHANKDAIIDGGISSWSAWWIPSIRNTGVSLQWTADTTKHAHITEIKDPARSSKQQQLRSPDMVAILTVPINSKRQGSDDVGDVNDNVDLDADDDHDDGDVDFDADVDHDIPHLLAMNKYPGHSRPTTNYFEIAKVLQHREAGTVPVPLRSIYLLTDAAIKFGLPDLRPAIADFLRREDTHGRDHIPYYWGGLEELGPTTPLPFDKLQVWFKLRLQDTDFHDISIIRPAQDPQLRTPF
ncbi:hypothetical protein DFJ58DRAFT_888393 [Suillus subalutaceus]|uniref:uncharacterized protein n=1 Tax=Suillus subalutaceus TaxID=48586 RepID=UPI001B876829|nr:uncharacterized protein DFJ58DRAFT_888393 [Suillus subalutaceus]KAG1817873.1 hypothetical protein DFJ58DRAFT_888393 [Suillus subalutaceus]